MFVKLIAQHTCLSGPCLIRTLSVSVQERRHFLCNLRTYSVVIRAGLRPQSTQICTTFSASRTYLTPSYLSHMTATARSADEYWHFYRSDFSNTLIYAHTTSRTLATCDISLHSVTLLALEAGRLCGINRAVSKEKLDRIHSVAYTSTNIVATVTLLSRIDFPVLILIITAQETVGAAQ